jgi:hypothetical protein
MRYQEYTFKSVEVRICVAFLPDQLSMKLLNKVRTKQNEKQGQKTSLSFSTIGSIDD